jgi:hypothetical protein
VVTESEIEKFGGVGGRRSGGDGGVLRGGIGIGGKA